MYINFENIFDEHSKNSKKGDKPVHYVAIMIVQKLNPAKLIDDVLAKQVISEGQSLEMIKTHFEGSQIVEPFIKLSIKCPLTQEPIKFPARGESCIHVQPFCLKSYLISIDKSKPRNFACPICKMPCHRLLYDKFLKVKVDEAIRQGLEHCYFNESLQFLLEPPLDTAVRVNKKGADTAKMRLESAEVVGVDLDSPKEQPSEAAADLVTLSTHVSLVDSGVSQNQLKLKTTDQQPSKLGATTTPAAALRALLSTSMIEAEPLSQGIDPKRNQRNTTGTPNRSKSHSKKKLSNTVPEGTQTPTRYQPGHSRSMIEEESGPTKLGASAKSIFQDGGRILSTESLPTPAGVYSGTLWSIGASLPQSPFTISLTPPTSETDTDLIAYLQKLLDDSQTEDMLKTLNQKIDLFFKEPVLKEAPIPNWD